jgi:hypothetical protein
VDKIKLKKTPQKEVTMSPLEKKDDYFILLKNLDTQQKLRLISELSNSLLEDEGKKEKLFYSLYGKLDIKQSADELIEQLRNERYFDSKKEIDL